MKNLQNDTPSYMYVFVRKDLSASQQVVQTAHASIEACKKFLTKESSHPHLIVFGAKNQNKIKKCMSHLEEQGVAYCEFVEPDMQNEITAIATEPLSGDKRKFLSKFCLL